jgi:hypothetical protein
MMTQCSPSQQVPAADTVVLLTASKLIQLAGYRVKITNALDADLAAIYSNFRKV